MSKVPPKGEKIQIMLKKKTTLMKKVTIIEKESRNKVKEVNNSSFMSEEQPNLFPHH